MKISLRPVGLRLRHPWAIARGGATRTFPVVVVELEDADGVRGLGEASPSARYGENAAGVAAFLARIEPGRLSFDDIPGSMRYLRGLAPGELAAQCAVNVALHDGAARRAGRALCDHLGLGFRDGAHVTSYSIGIAEPRMIRRKVLAAADFPVLKIKLGVSGDRENFAALRSAAPARRVRADANEGWRSADDALRALDWLAADGHVEFVEQPLPDAAPAAEWRRLRDRSPLPIFADESCRTAADVARCAERCHGVNVKLAKAGGIDAAIETLRAARAAGLRTMLGCMVETSVLITAAAHLAELADYLDLDGNLLIANDPYRGVSAAGGMLSFAEAPEPCGLRVAPALLPPAA